MAPGGSGYTLPQTERLHVGSPSRLPAVACGPDCLWPTEPEVSTLVSTGWRDVTRTARPLRQCAPRAEHEAAGPTRSARALHVRIARSPAGRRCIQGGLRQGVGKEAVSLERGLALKEVDVFLKTLAGTTRQIRFVSRGGDAAETHMQSCARPPSAMFCGLRASFFVRAAPSFFVRAAFRTSPPRFEQGAQTDTWNLHLWWRTPRAGRCTLR